MGNEIDAFKKLLTEYYNIFEKLKECEDELDEKYKDIEVIHENERKKILYLGETFAEIISEYPDTFVDKCDYLGSYFETLLVYCDEIYKISYRPEVKSVYKTCIQKYSNIIKC